MQKKRSEKPKYGLYAIKIIAVLFSVIEVIGLLLLSGGHFVFNNTYLTIGGGIITVFGIYKIVAHFLSLHVFTRVDATRFGWIAKRALRQFTKDNFSVFMCSTLARIPILVS